MIDPIRVRFASLVVFLMLAGACSDRDVNPLAPALDVSSTNDSAGTVEISPGDDIQAAVSASPPGTRFLIKAGRHVRQAVRPKDGMVFSGEPGAVLDGEDATPHAFETLRGTVRGVTIEGLVIERYSPPRQQSAIQADNSEDWVITGNEIRFNANHGLRLGRRTRAVRNQVHHNGVLGIGGYRTEGVLLEGNEVAFNHTEGLDEARSTAEASGIKLVEAQALTIRGNRVHHNQGKGIWTDTSLRQVVIEDNLVTDNSSSGIWHEAGYDAIIRNNLVERNGGPGPGTWLTRAGIQVTNSAGVQILGNTVRDSANGIGVMQAPGYPPGPYGPKVVANLSVRDNVVFMRVGRTGLGQQAGNRSVYRPGNNSFEGNTYHLGDAERYFTWDERDLTESEWRALGHDVGGQFFRGRD